METYALALTYAIPGFVALILIEYFASIWMGKEVNRSMDTISSLSSGMTNTLKDLVGLSIVILSYGWMVEHMALTQIPSTTAVYIIAFILIDFASYWSHRWNHEINLFWNRHIVHHSSEEFNLSCALRQSISGIVGIYFFLSIPMALLGIPATVVAIVGPLHLFAQFWYHTRLINRMGWLEHIIVTPSHHRVHHAINPEYIDKNFAAIFIIWDKWFGTFQEEMEAVPPVFGVKKSVQTWNPFLINYQHLWQLIKDAWRADRLVDKFKIWFMPTGWRPADVQQNHPVAVIDDVYSQVKYEPQASTLLKRWSWFQLLFNNLLIYYALIHIADFSFFDLAMYALFIAFSIFAYTSLMDRDLISVIAEIFKVTLGLILIVRLGGWFSVDEYIPGATIIMIVYIISSLIATLYFNFGERRYTTVEAG